MEQQSAHDPREAYRRKLEARRAEVVLRNKHDRTLSYVRMATFLAGAALVWPILFSETLAWTWILVPAVVFAVLVLVHDRVARRLTRARRATAFYERALARLDDDWAGKGNPGDAFLDEHHPYAADLDLFGHGSLFERLCEARTRCGERTLARWLCEPASPDEIRERQSAVEELRNNLDLREDLAALGEDVEEDDHPDALVAWATQPSLLSERWPVWIAAVLALVSVAAIVGWAAFDTGRIPVLLALAVGGALAALYHARARRVLGGASRPEHELELLSGVLARLEREQFRSPRLRRLRAELETEGLPPSRRIARLARLVQVHDSRRNMIFAPISAVLLLGTQLAFALERWRAASGLAVERWLATVGEVEALSSIAAIAFDRPEDPFPEIVGDEACFDGTRLGHPLLPGSRCVRNDVSLGPGLRLLLVSGSNMSGKSTLLRTVGVNAVLALAGAPVRAERLRISPVAVGACMRVLDSLQEGTSHFYAEIKRLRRIVDLGDGGPPLLFLLDEILHGTNSHDRRVGAGALVRGLVERGGIGLVTTHDLALAEIADGLGPRAENVHFEDHLEGDRIAFDYSLKPGVVRKSNALGLMRAVGLKV